MARKFIRLKGIKQDSRSRIIYESLDVNEDGTAFVDTPEVAPDYFEFVEQASDPAAPAANKARLFAKDNGSGKTLLCVRFSSGAVQTVATQP